MLVHGLEQMHSKFHVVHRFAAHLPPSHKVNIYIRDLKPENILLNEKGYCRIIDFNIAVICKDEKCEIANERHSTVGTMPFIGKIYFLVSFENMLMVS